MTPYVVRQGEHLALLALRHGFEVRDVWNHPKNAALNARRKSPHILAPGDVVHLPAPAAPDFLPVKLGEENRITVPVPRARVSVTFSMGGKPLAGVACIARGMPPPNQFTTDGSGKLTIYIPLTIASVTVEFPSIPLARRLRVGHLDPIDEPSGAFQRLRALGYVSARTTLAPDSPGLRSAISAFQKDGGLPVSGVLDPATIDALETAHGC